MNFRVAAVALLVGGGLALGTTLESPATAQELQEQLPGCNGPISFGSVTPERVPAGGSVVFSSCGFAPGGAVTIDVNGARTQTVTADGTGNFAIRLTLPTQGDHYLTGTGAPKDAVETAPAPGGQTGSGIEAHSAGADAGERKVIGMVWVDASDTGNAASTGNSRSAEGAGGRETGGETDGGLPVSGTQAGVIAAVAVVLIGVGMFFRTFRRRPRDGELPRDAS
ncbi:hypothetical protein [Protofrankia symbiont of Coriaria ruscifolia]|uniref:hypothetical protein n=1 Tax=Protofrankia symbiont of Coriaria ruscifolia TaxID=1306542 RepID=UPI001040F53E|nr:hypothetical protein [Protofrankia symbiont of Coriaria ruscifolia]